MNGRGGERPLTGKAAEALVFRFGGFETRVVFSGRFDLPETAAQGGLLIVIDETVQRLHGGSFALAAGPQGIVVPAGEGSKSWERARAVLQGALSRGLDRDGTIVGIGGGVVCDLAAFCASVYMRGCRLVLVPTSLLAMVDAALGGKTAVNFEGFKNLVGSFYPAGEVRIGIELLGSLSDREFLSGLGEVIKTALLGDEELFSLLRERRPELLRRRPELLSEVVRRCLVVKGRVVEEDFRENGRRAVLNLGHTFAHALESVSGLGAWSHGGAVAWGLARAARLGMLAGVTPPEHAARIRELLSAYGYRIGADVGVSPRRIVAAMRADKKRREGRVRLVLQRGIGDTVVQAVEESLVLQSLEDS